MPLEVPFASADRRNVDEGPRCLVPSVFIFQQATVCSDACSLATWLRLLLWWPQDQPAACVTVQATVPYHRCERAQSGTARGPFAQVALLRAHRLAVVQLVG